jgi:hypothetical protein
MVDAWGVSRSSSLRLHHSDDGLGSKDHSVPVRSRRRANRILQCRITIRVDPKRGWEPA